MARAMRILIIAGDTEAAAIAAEGIAAGLEVVGRSEIALGTLAAVQSTEPDAVLVDLEWPAQEALELIRQITQRHPRLPVIAVTSIPRSRVNARAVPTGLVNVMQKPLDWGEVRDFLRDKHVKDRAELGSKSDGRRDPVNGCVVAVAGAKGGAGRTMVAINLAVALIDRGASVVVADFDLEFGDVALALDIVPEATIADLPQIMEGLEPAVMGRFLTQHSTGLRVLAAPLRPGQERRLTPHHIGKLLATLRRMFDFVVVDLPRGFGPVAAAAIEAADRLLLVTDAQIASLKNTRLALPLIGFRDFEPDGFQLVLNRTAPDSNVVRAEVEAALGRSIHVDLPYEKKLAKAWLEGKPVVRVAPRSRLSGRICDLAGALAPEINPASRRRGISLKPGSRGRAEISSESLALAAGGGDLLG